MRDAERYLAGSADRLIQAREPADVPVRARLALPGRHQVGNAHTAAAGCALAARNGPEALRRLSPAALVAAIDRGIDTGGLAGAAGNRRAHAVDRGGRRAQRRVGLAAAGGVAGRFQRGRAGSRLCLRASIRGIARADIVRELAPLAAHVVLDPHPDQRPLDCRLPSWLRSGRQRRALDGCRQRRRGAGASGGDRGATWAPG